MKVAITGATGFIGGRLARSFHADGHQVIAFTRDPAKAPASLAEKAELVAWDARSVDPLAGALNGIDAVVHLAGENIGGSRWNETFKQRVVESRIKSGEALATAIERLDSRPNVFVQASGIGYYGSSPHVVDEDSPAGDGFLASVSRQWEPSTAAVDILGVRRVIVRTGVVLDKDEGALPKMALPYRFFGGGVIGDGKNWFPWIHIDDEVAAIRFLIENGDASGPFNLCAPNPVTSAAFAKSLGKAMRRPAWMRVPAFLPKLALGEMADELLFASQNARPKRLLDAGFEFRFAHADGALADLYGR